MRRPVLLALFLLALPARAEAAPLSKEKPYLYLQPLGGEQLPDQDVALVKQALVAFYGLEIKVLPRIELPASAYYKPRKRYRADPLLGLLEKQLPADGYRILGLTGVDISTTKGKIHDWGILGLATIDGGSCVISAFRCRMRARDARHARIRLAKVAVHEIGHTLGLEHCPTVGCLMEDAKGKVATCDREHDICPRCRARLAKLGRSIPARPAIPWPRP